MFQIISPLRYLWCEIWPSYCENQLLRTLWSSKIKRRAPFFFYIYLLSKYAYISKIYRGSWCTRGTISFLSDLTASFFLFILRKKRLFFVNTVRRALEFRTELSNIFCTKKEDPFSYRSLGQSEQATLFFLLRNFLSEDNRPWREDQSWKSTSSSRISNETSCQNLTFLAFF